MKPLIIIPTLNEVNSISILISKIEKQYSNCHIIIVDGGSSDGTIEAINRLRTNNSNIFLTIQEPGSGFGEALKLGFSYAIKNQYDPIITMDGDLSHSPDYLSVFFEESKSHDLVIGSRYINGVRVEGWKFRKLLTSKLANIYISYILVKPIWDFTSGFRCYRLKFIESLDLDDLDTIAYIIQIQLLYLAFKKKFSVKEIPFIYREIGSAGSKVYPHSKRRTFFFLLKYRAPFFEILRHLTYLKKDYKRYVQEYEELINPPKFKHNGEFELKSNYTVSVGVMAYNEENLISRCLDGLLCQKLNNG
ncbi:MAG: glycosyltransferase, partial [Calditrichaceae bacterium]